MKRLRNWDNKTWLSSKKYVTAFNSFLKKKIKFNKNTKILDIGCGRANIISSLNKKYNFKYNPIGIDIVKNKDIKKNIIFKKIDAIQFLKKKDKFDLILIKQTIHFFPKKKLSLLLNLTKQNLNPNGKILIFSLEDKKNEIPCFKLMRKYLNNSIEHDKILSKIIIKILGKTINSRFSFKVKILKNKYLSMIKSRYISCLLDISKKNLDAGIDELKFNYKNKIEFIDSLSCIEYKN